MKECWLARRYRGNLVDMHIPEWNPEFLQAIDAEQYAALLEKAGVNAAYLYASSCLGLCYWPTRVGHPHAGLKGRDFVGDRIRACRARGMAVILYHNWWSKWAYDKHPDWRFVNARGMGTAEYMWRSNRYGVCCLNSPYADFFLAQIEELCRSYDFEGLWIDMIAWPYSVCFCGHCRRRYREETGRELPRVVNWEDPLWVSFQRRREAWLAELLARVTATARRLKPGVTVGYQSAPWSLGWACGVGSAFFAQGDYVSGDFYGGAAEQSLVCKLFADLSEQPLFEFMSPQKVDLSDHTTLRPRARLAAQAFAALAHNGRQLFIDAIDPVGTLNPAVYEELGAVTGQTRPYEAFLEPDARRLADAAVYFNFESMIDPRDNGKPIAELGAGAAPLSRDLSALAGTLREGHIAFRVFTPKNLEELDSVRLLVLPELLMLDEREAEALRGYVRRGGRLVVTGATGLLNKEGVRQPDFLLADLLGVSWRGETAESVTFLAPTPEGAPLLAPFSVRYPLTIKGRQMVVTIRPGARVLATTALPYGDPQDPVRFGSANGNPPGRLTDNPALVLNEAGRGRVLYLAGGLERMPHDAHRTIFRRLLEALDPGPPLVRAEAPAPVEFLVFDQPARKRLLISVFNGQDAVPPIPVHGLRLAVRLNGRRPAAPRLLPDGKDLAWNVREGYAEFELPRLDTFLMLTLPYE